MLEIEARGQIRCTTMSIGVKKKKRFSWFPTRPDTRQTVQLQKMARGLKIRIQVVEGVYYPFSENKGVLLSHMQKAGFLITRLPWR